MPARIDPATEPAVLLALQGIAPTSIAGRLGIGPQDVVRSIARARAAGIEIPEFSRGKKRMPDEEKREEALKRVLASPRFPRTLTPETAAVAAASIALHALPPESRRIDELVHVEGYSREDLARMCDMSVTEISAHLAVVSGARLELERARHAAFKRAHIVQVAAVTPEQTRPKKELPPEIDAILALAMEGHTPIMIGRRLKLHHSIVHNSIRTACNCGAAIPFAVKKKDA